MCPPPESTLTDPNQVFTRAAFASIRGYVYQAWWSVLRLLELEEGWSLRLEGHEDIDFEDGRTGPTQFGHGLLRGGANVGTAAAYIAAIGAGGWLLVSFLDAWVD